MTNWVVHAWVAAVGVVKIIMEKKLNVIEIFSIRRRMIFQISRHKYSKNLVYIVFPLMNVLVYVEIDMQ